MPRFGVNFGKRKTAAHSDDSQNGPVGEPSFRVLDRAEVAAPAKGPVDVGRRASQPSIVPMPGPPKASLSIDPYGDDNMFADLKYNRSSGASNVTKTTASTDNSSRHSNASTAPSTADLPSHEDFRNGTRKPFNDIPVPPVPKSSSSWSLKNAGRTFSFGAQKKQLPTVPSEPAESEKDFTGRARSKTASTTTTSTTATPPTLTDQEFNLDLGGDFSTMFSGSGFDKRASVMTLLQQQQLRKQAQEQAQEQADDRPALAPRSLTGNRLNQPTPIRIDRTTRVEESPYSWNSQHSGDQLISASPIQSPNENFPPPVPKHGAISRVPRTNTDNSLKRSSAVFSRRRSTEPAEGEDEDAKLLKQSIAVAKFLDNPPPAPSSSAPSGRYRRNERVELKDDDDNIFDSSLTHSTRAARRFVSRQPSPPRNKVMTPAEFERYRQDKARQDTEAEASKKESDDDEEVNYEDDEDEIEKAKQLSKQRRKQEANMAVYRQQMMKVTGESNQSAPGHSFSASLSTPNLTLSVTPPVGTGRSEGSDPDEDEEVPLAILAAHGFPNKNRPPNRLTNMMSNPNLRASVMAPNIQRPESAMEGSTGGGRLPAFARRLPQDPYGLVNNAVRESIHLSGGSPTPGHPSAVPPGGLVGVIASEERSRAMRRGSPSIDPHGVMGQGGLVNGGNGGFDSMGGIPPNMMYPQQQQMLTPGDQAQMQMNQQMQQFMQMQMQFMQMQMMATQQNPGAMGGMRPTGHMPVQSMGDIRRSFLDPGYDSVRGDAAMRTMSMVQPSSGSLYGQPMGGMNMGAPSIHIQGQYAPSIAPSERSNIGLPGRYRPVSHLPPPVNATHQRSVSTMSGALGGSNLAPPKPASKPTSDDDDDEEKGWEAMKAKREKKKSMWRSKKTFGSELGALIH